MPSLNKVLNKHLVGSPPGAVYIGRPSKWGNPFVIGKDGDRGEVIAKYRAWLLTNPELLASAKQELAGKDLLCFCAPAACHGDVLLNIVNSPSLNKQIDQICSSCGKPQTIETRQASEKRYSRITLSICGCGVSVKLKTVYDLDKIISSHPLPGYDLEAMRQKFAALGLLS